MDCTSCTYTSRTYTSRTYTHTSNTSYTYTSCACRCPRCGTEFVYSGPKGVIEPDVPFESAARPARVTCPGTSPSCPGGGPARPGDGVVRPRNGHMPD